MKSEIKKRYLEKLRATYPAIYTDGSRPIELANLAADNALAGKIKVEGDCWRAAVKEITGWKSWTMRALSELPE